MLTLILAAALSSSGSPLKPFPQADSLQQLAQLPGNWSEGPVWVASENCLVFGAASTRDNDAQSIRTTLYKYVPGQGLRVLAPEGAFRSNGMAIDEKGDILAAMHDTREIARLRGRNLHRRTSVVSTFAGRPFNSPNDLAIRHDGTMYFTDPTYEQAGRLGQDAARVYRVSPDGQVFVVDAERDQPNGIALSPAHDVLYVGGRDRKILQHRVASDGSTEAGTLFTSTQSNVDGMTVDDDGNVYASLFELPAIVIYSPEGAELHRIPTPGAVTNLAFGGADRKTLFITCAGQLYGLPMPIAGSPY